jgi:Cdc6-like AAA superfamily ATPase
MSRNKFYPDKPVPPDKFVCRTSELSTIFDKINSRDHVAIYGSLGMGKTSLLRYIKDPKFWEERGLDFSEALIVYHNCELSTVDSFWQEVLTKLRNEAGDDAYLQSKIDDVLNLETIEITNIREVIREIGKKDKFLLLLLDNYHLIFGTKEEYDYKKPREMLNFLSELRNLAVHSTEGQYFSTIVTTFQKLHELGPEITPGGSPWYNHYAYLPLKPFIQDDIDNHFFNPDSHFFISIPEDVPKEKVLEMTGGYPGLLQCTGDVFSKCDPVDVNTLNKKLKNYADKIFQDIWKSFEKNEQEILQSILIYNSKGKLRGNSYSIAGIEKEFIRKSRILNTLQEKGFINQVKKLNKYNFTSSLMTDFIGDQLEDQNVSNAKERKIVINLFIIKITLGQWKQFKEKIQPVTNLISPLARIFNFFANKIEGK